MIDIVIFIVLAVMAIRINRAVSREAPIFDEFHQPKGLGLVVFLYPLAPIAILFGVGRVGSIPAVVAASLCLAPGLIVSRRRIGAFERSGTDRTQRALALSTQAFGTALAGYLYIALVATFAVVHLVQVRGGA